jgi:hypothetical protein
MNRRLATLLVLVLAAVTSFAPPASADVRSGIGWGVEDNLARADNTAHGAMVVRTALSVVHDTDGVIDESNVAWATASCEACQAAAVALQVVVVSGPATTVQPVNLALAVNEACTACETAAVARQFVVRTEAVASLSGDAKRALYRLYTRFDRLDDGGLTVAEITTEANAIGDELEALLTRDLGTTPEDHRADDRERGDDD